MQCKRCGTSNSHDALSCAYCHAVFREQILPWKAPKARFADVDGLSGIAKFGSEAHQALNRALARRIMRIRKPDPAPGPRGILRPSKASLTEDLTLSAPQSAGSSVPPLPDVSDLIIPVSTPPPPLTHDLDVPRPAPRKTVKPRQTGRLTSDAAAGQWLRAIESGAKPVRSEERSDAESAKTVVEKTRAFDLPRTRRRVMALTVDALVVFTVVQTLALAGVFGEPMMTVFPFDPDFYVEAALRGDLTNPFFVAMAVTGLGAFLMHRLLGASIGKRLAGLRVVDTKTGETPGLMRCAVRTLLGIAGFLAGGIGYLWVIVDKQRRPLHDILSGTATVRA